MTFAGVTSGLFFNGKCILFDLADIEKTYDNSFADDHMKALEKRIVLMRKRGIIGPSTQRSIR